MTQTIRDTTRARIYERDTPSGQESPACVYCGRSVRVGSVVSDSEGGRAAATLDHVRPTGGNSAKNLVTACWDCNSDKGTKTLADWQRRPPPWRSRRARPAETLAERVAIAVARPLCTAKACAPKIEAIDDRRKAGAYWSRVASRRR